MKWLLLGVLLLASCTSTWVGYCAVLEEGSAMGNDGVEYPAVYVLCQEKMERNKK